jgi:peptidoglycan/xylan/chitin deacetylase (PgdA/CDA1 family)
VTLGYLAGLRSNRGRREGIRVLCFHGVVESMKDVRLERNLHPLSNFRSLIQFLRRFRMLSLHEVIDEISWSKRHRKQRVVITFDDGYANNLVAAEILETARLPWTLFIPTGAVGSGNMIWSTELSLLILHGRADKLEVLGRTWSLKSKEEREAAFQAIRYPMKSISSTLREQTMDSIRRQFPKEEAQRLLNDFPSLQMLSWKEISQLASAGVEIGSHGVHHEIHHDDQPEVIRQRELKESKVELERRLGRPCHFFAFPDGKFNQASGNEVQAARYKLGFITGMGSVKLGVNPYLLPRLSPPASVRTFVRNFFWVNES